MRLQRLCFLILPLLTLPAYAGSILGSASSFAVLGGAGVAVNGSCCTVISGSVGDYPSALSLITGFPSPGSVVNGTFYAADSGLAIANQAQIDENAAFTYLEGLSPAETLLPTDILGTGGTPGYATFLPGVYAFSSSAQVDGALTLNFNGESNAMFVFQIGSTLTTGSSASIVVEGANSTDSIYWVVDSSATLGSSTAFEGNILAADSITLDPSATIVCGRALADTGSVTFAATNSISNNCNTDNFSTGATDFGSNGFNSSSSPSPIPEPGSMALLGSGLMALAGFVRRKRHS